MKKKLDVAENAFAAITCIIAIFRINRPEAMGALNVEGMTQLHQALLSFRDDDDPWVGIITGTGDKVFSAGVDIKDYLPPSKQYHGQKVAKTSRHHSWVGYLETVDRCL